MLKWSFTAPKCSSEGRNVQAWCPTQAQYCNRKYFQVSNRSVIEKCLNFMRTICQTWHSRFENKIINSRRKILQFSYFQPRTSSINDTQIVQIKEQIWFSTSTDSSGPAAKQNKLGGRAPVQDCGTFCIFSLLFKRTGKGHCSKLHHLSTPFRQRSSIRLEQAVFSWPALAKQLNHW